jgi:hypothetical protein
MSSLQHALIEQLKLVIETLLLLHGKPILHEDSPVALLVKTTAVQADSVIHTGKAVLAAGCEYQCGRRKLNYGGTNLHRQGDGLDCKKMLLHGSN